MMGIESMVAMSISDVEIVDDYAYTSGYPSVLLKVSPGQPPVVVDELPIWSFRMARVNGGICAVGFELSIIDVAPATRGRVLGELSLPFSVRDVAGSGSYAYLIDDEFGLWVIDTSNPAAPRIVGSAAIPGERRAIAARNDLVAVANHSGLWIIDVTDQTSPERVSFYPTQYGPAAVELVDRFAVMAYGPWIEVIDLGDPTSPKLVQRAEVDDRNIQDLAFDGARGYLCGENLTVIDLNRPTSPVIARIPSVHSRRMAVAGDRAYLGGDRGFVVVDLAGPRRPSPLAQVNAQGTAWRTALKPPLAVVAGTVLGLWVVDLQGSPGVSGRLDLEDHAYDVTVDSTYAYVAAGGLVVAEVGTTLPPRLLNHLHLPGESLAIVLDDRLVYLAQRHYGLWIADVSDPLAPRIVGSVDTPGEAWDVAVRDGWAWVTGYQTGLAAVDVSDPRSPRVAAHIVISESRSLALAGDYAYVGSERGVLHVVDITIPTAPEIVAKLADLTRISDVAVDGDLAYLASDGGLLVVDVTEPRSPVLVGTADEDRAIGVLVDSETQRIYVANGNLEILRPQCQDAIRGVQP
jgi:hypothetical protein